MTPALRIRDWRYEHHTESAPEVLAFLERVFHTEVTKPYTGADLQAGDITVEVKSAQEWNRTNHANGKRRRGRFQLYQYDQADYFLFVLCHGDGTLRMRLMKEAEVIARFGNPREAGQITINHQHVFQKGGTT